MTKLSLRLLSFVLLVSFTSNAQIISTFAGNGVPAYSGDGGQAVDAEIHGPSGMHITSGGDLYFADRYNNVIRKITSAGVISTVAGNGTMGFSGDGGSATDASLNSPVNVTVDGNGNLYIADMGNNRVRMVSGAGIISTIAGNGTAGYNGENDTATKAALNGPSGVAIDDSGNVFIADKMNSRIRMVDANGGIKTVVGVGIGGYNGDNLPSSNMVYVNKPSDVTISPSGNLYIADTYNGMIRKLDKKTGKVSTILATFARYPQVGPNLLWTNRPTGLDFDSYGNLYVSNETGYSIVKLDTNKIVYTICGGNATGFTGDGGRASDALMSRGMGVAADDAGNIYLSDFDNERVRYITTTVSTKNVVSTSAKLNVFPNPSNFGRFTIDLSGVGNVSYTYSFTDVVGRVVCTGTGNAGALKTVSMCQPDGVYFLTVSTENNKWTQKVSVLN